eukprot:gene5842-6128_t
MHMRMLMRTGKENVCEQPGDLATSNRTSSTSRLKPPTALASKGANAAPVTMPPAPSAAKTRKATAKPTTRPAAPAKSDEWSEEGQVDGEDEESQQRWDVDNDMGVKEVAVVAHGSGRPSRNATSVVKPPAALASKGAKAAAKPTTRRAAPASSDEESEESQDESEDEEVVKAKGRGRPPRTATTTAKPPAALASKGAKAVAAPNPVTKPPAGAKQHAPSTPAKAAAKTTTRPAAPARSDEWSEESQEDSEDEVVAVAQRPGRPCRNATSTSKPAAVIASKGTKAAAKPTTRPASPARSDEWSEDSQEDGEEEESEQRGEVEDGVEDATTRKTGGQGKGGRRRATGAGKRSFHEIVGKELEAQSLKEMWSGLMDKNFNSKQALLARHRTKFPEWHFLLKVMKMSAQIESIKEEAVQYPERRVYLVLNNIDGPGLRDPADQRILSELASCSNVHLTASCDNVNTSLLWNKDMASRFSLGLPRRVHVVVSPSGCVQYVCLTSACVVCASLGLVSRRGSALGVCLPADGCHRRCLTSDDVSRRVLPPWLCPVVCLHPACGIPCGVCHGDVSLSVSASACSRRWSTARRVSVVVSDPPAVSRRCSGEAQQQKAESVLRSMMPAARDAFKLLAEYLIDDPEAEGATFQLLFRMCRERFIVSKEDTLRHYLTEFQDHELLAWRVSSEGTDVMYIPLKTEEMQRVVDEISEIVD